MCDIPPQTCESISSPLETGDLPAVVVNLEASLEPVRDAVLALRERVEDLCNQELGKITKQGSAAKALLVLPAYCFTSHLSLPYLLPVFFQSMTQPCLRWETVSVKCYFFAAVSSLLPFNEFFLFQLIVTHRKEGFLNVSLC